MLEGDIKFSSEFTFNRYCKTMRSDININVAYTLTIRNEMSHGNIFQRKHLFIEEVLPSVDKDNATGQLEKRFPGTGKHSQYPP